MFTNLKNKLLEEVKASPQKFQQIAQAAQAAVSSTSSTASESVPGSDNFFSITEEDTPQNSPHRSVHQLDTKISNTHNTAPTLAVNNGITIQSVNRTRKLSNSSVASDVSFRLPSYDPSTVHHFQSDLDVSASETEDSFSITSNTRLDVISKEQLHDAYKKAFAHYQKYRLQYTKLVKRYHDLERDSSKSRAVLVETQDKALRRINELKEQCNLEQQAKAHLEEALRVEMDDMQCKISAYQTKLKLLGENPENVIQQIKGNKNVEEPLIQLGSDEINLENCMNNEVNHDRNTTEKISSSERDEELEVLEKKLAEADKEIAELKLREEENSYLLAENKLMIHSELENKEKEVKKLKDNIGELEKKLEEMENQNLHLQKQANQLPELELKIKQLTDIKQELYAKIISNEHLLGEVKKLVKEKEKQIAIMEEEITSLKSEHEEKINSLKLQETNVAKMRQKFYKFEIDLAQTDNELNNTKIENNQLKETIEQFKKERQEFEAKIEEYDKQLNETMALLEINKTYETEIAQYNDQIVSLKKKIEEDEVNRFIYEQEINKLQKEVDNLRSRDIAIDTSQSEYNEQIKKLREELELKMALVQDKNITELTEKLKKAEQKIKNILEEKICEEKEKIELKSQVDNILREISKMEIEMNKVKESHDALEVEKRSLEDKIEIMTRQNQENQEGNAKWQKSLQDIEDQLESTKMKLEIVEAENSRLKETNFTLEDDLKQINLLLKQNENNYKSEKSALNKIIREQTDEAIKKLNEKMSQVLDENSRLHNAKEIMEHEFRSLQDQYNVQEKEKLCVLDSNKCLENENEQLQKQIEEMKVANGNLIEKLNSAGNEFLMINDKITSEKEKSEKILSELKVAKATNESLVSEIENLKKELLSKSSDAEHVEELKQKNQLLKDAVIRKEQEYEELKERFEMLDTEHTANLKKLETSFSEKTNVSLTERNSLEEKLNALSQENLILQEQNKALMVQLDDLTQVINEKNAKFNQSNKNLIEFEKKFDQIKVENEYLNTKTGHLKTEIEKYVEEKAKLEEELNIIKECEANYKKEIIFQSSKIEELQNEVEKLNETIISTCNELSRQKGNSDIIIQQSNDMQHQLSVCQQKLTAAEKLCDKTKHEFEEVLKENSLLKREFEEERNSMREHFNKLFEENEKNKIVVTDLTKELMQATKLLDKLQNIEEENSKLVEMVQQLEIELSQRVPLKSTIITESSKSNVEEIKNLREINTRLQNELEELKHKSSAQISNLSQEIDDLTLNSRQLSDKSLEFDKVKEENKQLIIQLEELRSTSSMKESSSSTNSCQELELVKQERNDLELRLKKIMHEVQDVSNRNLFLEQKCENYLILEQSNERLKLANEKLSRQLDETLVSLQHNEGISANTEFEYLRNIMFQYLTGTVTGNNDTLIKVIAAVLKFSPQQTQVAIEKEHQRHSLIGQLNNLL